MCFKMTFLVSSFLRIHNFITHICTQLLQQSAKVHVLLFVSTLKNAAAFLEYVRVRLDFGWLSCKTDW